MPLGGGGGGDSWLILESRMENESLLCSIIKVFHDTQDLQDLTDGSEFLLLANIVRIDYLMKYKNMARTGNVK